MPANTGKWVQKVVQIVAAFKKCKFPVPGLPDEMPSPPTNAFSKDGIKELAEAFRDLIKDNEEAMKKKTKKKKWEKIKIELD